MRFPCWYVLSAESIVLWIDLTFIVNYLAGMVLSPLRKLSRGNRGPLVVEANRKKGLGSTLFGSRRKRARVSGFRTRMASVGGRKVLKARRKKGRKNLVPGGRPVRK